MFTSDDAGNAGGPDAGADASSEGSVAEGGSPPGPGEITQVTSEKAAARFVATDATSIYWWSVQDSAITKRDKTSGVKASLISLPQRTVTALAVDAASVYWIETGAGDDGGVRNRIMRAMSAGGGVTVLYETANVLEALALTASQVGVSESGGLDIGPKTGAVTQTSLGITLPLLAADDTHFFYFFTDVLARYPSGQVATGIARPAAIIAETSSVYVVVASANGSGASLIAVDNAETGGDVSTKMPLATFTAGAIHLAIDNLGVVVGNAADGNVLRVSRTPGTAPTSIATGRVSLNAVAADPDGVYWSTETGEVGWSHR